MKERQKMCKYRKPMMGLNRGCNMGTGEGCTPSRFPSRTRAAYAVSGLLALVLPSMSAFAADWTPSRITTRAWYDAADTNTLTLVSGNRVSQWKDKSGNNRHVSQSTSTDRPVYSGSSQTAQVGFNGTNYYLSASFAFMCSNGQIDAYIVMKAPPQDDTRFIGEGWSGGPGFYALQTRIGSQPRLYIRNNSSTDIITSIGPAGAFNSVKNLVMYRDTGSKAIHMVNTGSATTNNYTRSGGLIFDRFAIGCMVRNTGPAGFSISDMNEIVITDNLSDADRQTMEGYLAWKWGMQDSLPADHPYKRLAPGDPKGTVIRIR
jgi:hypothetical protein